MIKIEGLDKLQRTLADAQKALDAVDGELGSVNFDPDDPGSIEAAISQMEALVDARLASYSSNAIIGPMVTEVKERYREAILERAAEVRMKGGDEQ